MTEANRVKKLVDSIHRGCQAASDLDDAVGISDRTFDQIYDRLWEVLEDTAAEDILPKHRGEVYTDSLLAAADRIDLEAAYIHEIDGVAQALEESRR